MKKGLFSYFAILIPAMGLAVLLLAVLSKGSSALLEAMNVKYMAQYRAGERGISSPWYEDGYHIVDEGFMRELELIGENDNNIISLGSSMSVIPFSRQEAEGDPHSYRFLVCGNGCWRSDIQLYNMYCASGFAHEGDIIKLEVSFSTFRPMELSITRSVTDKWGAYIIDDEDNVRPAAAPLAPVYALNRSLIRLQNVFELEEDARGQVWDNFVKGTDRPVVPGNFRNDYFNYQAVADSCGMDEDMKQKMEQLIDRIASEHVLVVELSPLPGGLADTAYGRQLEDYIETELIPLLYKKGIRVLDYRRDFADEDFCDGVHPGYEAGIRYTRKLLADMNL